LPPGGRHAREPFVCSADPGRRRTVMRAFAITLAGLALTLAAPDAGAADKNGGRWGTIKGQVVFNGKKLPEPQPLKVDKDQKHCLSKGKILDEEWVVNSKNKGVRWAIVWLAADPTAENKTLPVHPELASAKLKAVVIDQPCCMFVPHVVALREGQDI